METVTSPHCISRSISLYQDTLNGPMSKWDY